MIKFLHAQIEMDSRRRPVGYLGAFRAKAQTFPTHLEISREDYDALNLAWPIQPQARPAPVTLPAPSVPKPPTAPLLWPLNAFGIMARTIKLLKQPEDVGVGDTLARVIGPIGGEAYKTWFLDTFGKSCGCTERQEQLNTVFPYEKTL